MILFSAALLFCSGETLQATPGDIEADISVKNRPLKEVVKSVQEQTGYRIELKSIDDSYLVTGQYSNAAVEKIFTHLLKGHNISIAVNTPDKLISVISLGGKIQSARDSKAPESILPIAADDKETESIPPAVVEVDAAALEKSVNDQSLELTGLSSQDLQALHVQQTKEFEQQNNNPNAVDPLTGFSRAELEDMQKRQIMALNQAIE